METETQPASPEGNNKIYKRFWSLTKLYFSKKGYELIFKLNLKFIRHAFMKSFAIKIWAKLSYLKFEVSTWKV